MGNRSLFHCSCGGSDNSFNVVVADREIVRVGYLWERGTGRG